MKETAMTAAARDPRVHLFPWVLTLGTICIKCRKPNDQPGNPATRTPRGWAHRNCR